MAVENWDQKRAAFAWKCIEEVPQQERKDYSNLVKSAPALIMNNGLMQTLAFFAAKDESEHKTLNRHIIEWLTQSQGELARIQATYNEVMQALFTGSSANYMRATEETFALLHWVKRFAAAAAKD